MIKQDPGSNHSSRLQLNGGMARGSWFGPL